MTTTCYVVNNHIKHKKTYGYMNNFTLVGLSDTNLKIKLVLSGIYFVTRLNDCSQWKVPHRYLEIWFDMWHKACISYCPMVSIWRASCITDITYLSLFFFRRNHIFYLTLLWSSASDRVELYDVESVAHVSKLNEAEWRIYASVN